MFKFTRNELRDLLIAFIVLSICFAISNVGLNLFSILSIMPIVMIGVGAGFLLHEIGHKFVSMKYGYWVEFKLWPLGLVIALVTAFLGFVFAAPGAVNTYADHMNDEINGRIAIAGPMTNMGLALVFIIIAALIYPFSIHSQSVNSYLAAFNLLPFATLDGIKVMKWNVLIWFVVFAIAAVMTLLSMTIGAENMVGLIIGM